VNFTRLDTNGKSNGHGLLHAMEGLLSSIFIPALRNLDKGWGALDNSPMGGQTKTDFLHTLDSFVSVLVGTLSSLCNTNRIVKDNFSYRSSGES
jgi:dynein heavy chain